MDAIDATTELPAASMPFDAAPAARGAGAVATRPKVLLAMPYYGNIAMGAARGYFCPTRGGVDVIDLAGACHSILPNTFNYLFCTALDARDKGQVTHLCILHSDVCPPIGWVDILWREMVAVGADVISAVVPIKDGSGRTSTAIGALDNPWHPTRYVMLGDRANLPVTFTAEHACASPNEVLLINTGCLLLDLRRPWWDVPAAGGPGGDGFAFEFRTRIVRAALDGPDAPLRRAPQAIPEDWLMSRHVHAHGGTVAATWAVDLEHRGPVGFRNIVDLDDAGGDAPTE